MAKLKQTGVWGIDIGQCALKALRLEIVDGEVTATAFDYVEHPKILSQPDADAEQLTREALEKFLSRNQLKGDMVAVSVAGQGGLARFVKLPPVEEKKIPDIVKFEAKQQIPFRLEEVVWDYQKIGAGEVTDGFAMETEIGLFAMKRDMVTRHLQHFKDVNIEVQIVQLAPLSLCNYLAYDLLHNPEGKTEGEDGAEEAGKKRCVVALDIGADNSNLVITDGAKIIWQRPIPLGGNHFTRALSKDLKLTFAKAEHLKRNATKSPDLKKILSALKPVLNDFVGEVQRSLGYFTNTHRDASVAYMVGLGNAFRLPGIQKFLSEKLQLEVRRLQKLQRLSGDNVLAAPPFTENVMSFAVAYGLALQGLRLARLHTNLLPQEIQRERMVRAKKPWAAAAAAALLIGVAGLTVCLASAHSKFTNKEVDDAAKKAEDAVAVANKFNEEVDKIKKNIEAKRLETQQMASGSLEQLNWSLILNYINEALPRPDGAGIPEEFKKKYFLTNSQKANEDLEKGANATEAIQQNLTQVNIHAIVPLWTDDIPAFLQKVNEKSPALEGMANDQATWIKSKDATKMPKKGWVFELRGYTYYRPLDLDANLRPRKDAAGILERDEPRQFLKDTLCYNLSEGGVLSDPQKVDRLAGEVGIFQILQSFAKKPADGPIQQLDGKMLWEIIQEDPRKIDGMLSKLESSPYRQKVFWGFVMSHGEEAGKLDDKMLEVLTRDDGANGVFGAAYPALNYASWQRTKKYWSREYETVWKNVKFVVLYFYNSKPNPQPGTFDWIKATYLGHLFSISGAGDKKVVRPPPAGGAAEAAAPAGDPQNQDDERMGWNPIKKTMLHDAFAAGVNQEEGNAEEIRKREEGNKQKGFRRYEFVIFFVWDEPLKSEQDAESGAGAPK